jgi:hypothetical protein
MLEIAVIIILPSHQAAYMPRKIDMITRDTALAFSTLAFKRRITG